MSAPLRPRHWKNWRAPPAARSKTFSNKKEAARKPPLFTCRRRSERDPQAIAPVAAAFMLAPVIAVAAPLPGIVMHGDAKGRLIGRAIGGVPAITFAVAGDISRGRRGQGGQRTRAGDGSQNKRPDFHCVSPLVGKSASREEKRQNPFGVPPSLKRLRSCGLERDPHAAAVVAVAFVIVAPVAVAAIPV